LLGSGFLILQKLDYSTGRDVFSTWPVLRSYKPDDIWSLVSSVLESVNIGLERVTLLEGVTRERLVVTQQAGKCLACAMVICKLWEVEAAAS
jgi:adenosylcobinamide amidohydrolase